MADGIYYRDLRQPFVIADLPTTITLATTQKMLWPYANSPTQLPANYWTVGKTLKLTALLKITNGTAGNYSFGMMFGAADAAAVNVASTARAFIASVGPFSCFIQGYATCRSIGSAGTISMWGMAYHDLAGMLSTSQPNVFPPAGVTVVSSIDTSVGTNHLCFQMSASAGTCTVVTTSLIVEALN
jgi:hypothetical protein